MFQYLSVVGIAAIVATTLMVAAMLYLVWGSINNDAHSPTPDTEDALELDEGEAADSTDAPEIDEGPEAADPTDAQSELTADGNSA